MKKKVRKITKDEFDLNEEKYLKIGKKEKVVVTKNGVTLFVLTKKMIDGLKTLHSFYGMLPNSVYDELYPEEEK